MHTLSEPTLNLAFLGCGQATRLHSRTLAGFGNAVRCSYASRSRAKAVEYASRFGGVAAFGSYDAALGSDKVDAVLVATPPAEHLDLCLRALNAGKHVIVEKPPFLRSSDVDLVEAASRESERRVLIAENYYYKPLAVRLRKILAAGWIGEVLFLHVNALKSQSASDWRQDPELAGGGALFEGGIHWINFMSHLGLTVRDVRGIFPPSAGAGDRSALVSFDYAEGAAGVLSYSWEVPSPLRGLRISRIYGREGSIAFESNGLFVLVCGRKTRFYVPSLRDLAGYRAMFADFLAALRLGAEPGMHLGRARSDLAVLEGIYRFAAADQVFAASQAVR